MWIAISLEAFELTVHFTVRKSCSLRNITWRSHKKDVKERKETSKIVWTTLLYQVDRCFPLTADVQKVCVPGQLFTDSQRGVFCSILRERAPRSAYTQCSGGVAQRTAARWLDKSSFHSSSGDVVTGKRCWDWKQGWRRERKAEGSLRSYFCFHRQDAKTGHNSYIGTF